MANLKSLSINGIVIDYIIEQGTNGIWTYRKWNSGVVECWGSDNITYANEWILQKNLDLPFSFSNIQCLTSTINDTFDNSGNTLSVNCKAAIISVDTICVTIQSVNNIFTSSTSVPVSINIKGTWK